MKWIKQGWLFNVEKRHSRMSSHAAVPIAHAIDQRMLRLFFSSRDERGRSLPYFVDVAVEDPLRVVHVHEEPILELGEPGTFDDSGVMPSWVISHENELWMYYIGWNPQVTVSYRVTIGLAVSTNGGKQFERFSSGPFLDRNRHEPYFCTTPCVLRDERGWHMWYSAGTSWAEIQGKWEPQYQVKYCCSRDGIDWQLPGTVCTPYSEGSDAISRPCVWRTASGFHMLYSHRSIVNYRDNREKSYRLGYAHSDDGLHWTRQDARVGIDRSENGWDSLMMENCHVLPHEGKTYLFYNGNGFGQSGFGYAVLDAEA